MIEFLAAHWIAFAVACFGAGLVIGALAIIWLNSDEEDKREACMLEYWRGHGEGFEKGKKISAGVRVPIGFPDTPEGEAERIDQIGREEATWAAKYAAEDAAKRKRDNRGRFVSANKPRKAKA